MSQILCATFSVVGRCQRTGEYGVAVATAVPGVGALVPHVSLEGAIATQSFTNTDLGIKGIALLTLGLSVERALQALLAEDEGREYRQVHGIDARGRTFAFTGQQCVLWCGHRTGADYSVAGNMLVGEETIVAMAEAFEQTSADDLELAERLVQALEAGQRAGGDKRGKRSAALLVAAPHPRHYHNVRVDDHTEPVAELRRIYEVMRASWSERAERYAAHNWQMVVKW